MGPRRRPAMGGQSRHHGRLAEGSSLNLPPPARGHPTRPPCPPWYPQPETSPCRHPPPLGPQPTAVDAWGRRQHRHHHTTRPREPSGLPPYLKQFSTTSPHLAHPPQHLCHYQLRTPRSEGPPATRRRGAPSAAAISHAGTPQSGAPRTSHHQNGTPPGAPHHPRRQRVA